MLPDSILIITYYVAGLLLNTFVAMGLAIVVFRGWHKSGSVWLGLLFLASAWWSLTILGELLVDTLPAKILWSKLLYPGAASVPVLMFLFVLDYCRQHKWLASRYRLLYWIVPFIATILAVTNEWHSLIWTSFTPRIIGDTQIFVYGHGPAYWLLEVYSYLLMIVAVGLLIGEMLKQTGLHRQQTAFLLLIIFLPWLADFGYNLNIVPGLDFTVFGLTLSGILMVWNLSRFNLLNLMPLATDQAFEEMQHAMVVLDNRHYVVNFNPAARQILGLSSAAVGHPIDETLAQCLDHNPQTGCELEWAGPPPRTLNVSVTPLTNRKKREVGCMIIWTDITAQRQAQHEKWERQLTLAVLEERQHSSNELHTEIRQILEHIVGLAYGAVELLEREQFAAAAASMAHLIEIARGGGANIDEFIESLQLTRARQTGFFQVLNQYINHFSQTHQLSVTLTWPTQPADLLLSSLAQIELLRIIQDILQYGVQQALTGAIQIIISAGGEWVQSVITLRGQTSGETANLQSVASLLEQRATSIGGSLETRFIPGQGSHIIVQLPRREPPLTKPFAETSIFLVDDHSVLLAGFKELLEQRGAKVVGVANNGEQAIELARELQPDIVLMDIRMPGMSGLEATRRIKAEFPNIKVVILTVSQDQSDLFEAFRYGASGYLLKTLEPDEFFDLLSGVVKGDMPLAPAMVEQLVTDITQIDEDFPVTGAAMLTSQQLDILRLVTNGKTYRQVGELLHISEHTVRYHIEQIRIKLNVSKRAEMVARAIQLGLVESPAD